MPHTQTQVIRGIGVGRGAVVGPVTWVQSGVDVPQDFVPQRQGRELTGPELVAETDAAFTAVVASLTEQAAQAEGVLGQVLEATAQMANDPALRSQTLAKIEEGHPPVAALDAVIESFVAAFTAAGGLMAERIIDLRSVRDRVVAQLAGLAAVGVPQLTEPSILVADDLAPAQTAGLNLDLVIGVITRLGGPTSHTAIIAGQLGIPCLVQVPDISVLTDADQVAIDAAAGTATINPSPQIMAAAKRRSQLMKELARRTGPGATADGHRVQLLGNIGGVADVPSALAVGAEGIGLFRTEFLYLSAQQAPTQTDQHEAYLAVLQAIKASDQGTKVVVRTLDAGADKPLPFTLGGPEENPALGMRGFRINRRQEEVIGTQLAALATAAKAAGSGAGVELWVMAPMIATLAEAAQFAELATSAGLRSAGAKLGVMVEVPAAALQAEALLAEVDFVSIGTNDLAQYTMATDRLAGELADLLDHWQPAVLALVAQTAQAGAKAGKPVGVCGESASDPLMALVLVGLGISSLSMNGGAIPAVRHLLAHTSLATCQQAARVALAALNPEAARAGVLALVDPEIASDLALN